MSKVDTLLALAGISSRQAMFNGSIGEPHWLYWLIRGQNGNSIGNMTYTKGFVVGVTRGEYCPALASFN